MTWLPAYVAWAGAALSLGAFAGIWLLLRRFMAGPPVDRPDERHYGAKGRASQWSKE